MDTPSVLGGGLGAPVRWWLRLLGGFELTVVPGDKKLRSLGKRERALLAYLAVSPNGREQRKKLAMLLWCDGDDETVLDNLRTCLWRLRKALGDGEHRLLATEGEEIVLDLAAFEVDAIAFRRLASQAGRTELEAAANLYSGEFLDGLAIDSEEFETWRRAESMRYRDDVIDVLTRLMIHLGECGETKSAIDVGNRILRLEPLHDAVVRRLMQLYEESGRHGTAVHLYRTLAKALRTELDAQPEAETRAVFEEIAGGSEERTPPTAADAKVSPHTPTMERLSGPLGEFSDATADAKLLPRYANTAHPSNLPGKPLQPAFRFRAPLAILAGVLIVATALVAYTQFALFGTRQAVVVERTVSASQASPISIAVMPFVNLSSDPEQEFFSDGMTDEITTALTKVSALRVVGRESAFQFRGQKTDMREIGQALGALYLIGGTVRKAGDRVRISVQLTRADNGVNLWAENYDRQLKDIFETQSDVAQAIAGALRVPLGLQQGQTLVSSRTNDEATYEDYLRAKALVRARGLKPLTDAIAMLERVVARDPEFAPAWALLAQAYDGIPSFHPAQNSGAVDEARRVVDATIPKAEAAAQRAIHLDPNLADGYISLGLVQRDRGRLLHAEDLFKQALALDPNNPDALHWYSMLIAEVGRLKEALTMRQKLQALEPFVPVFNQNTAAVLWLNGQNDAAIVILRALSQDSANRALYLASIHAAAGRYSEAADVLLTTPSMTYLTGTVDEAGRLLRAAPASAASQQSLPHLGLLGFIYLYVGTPNRVLEFYESNVQAGYLIPSYAILLWHPSYAPVRKTERFKRLMRDAGLVNFWRARGWPALCSPVGADDFVCT